MTSREFTPRLLELGARLDRHGLNNGLKTDETIFRFFLEQYNDQNKNNSSSFSHLNFNQDASKFTPFPVDDWAKAKKKFNSISSDYNAAFNSSTQSGFHGSFSDVAMVKTQPWLEYLQKGNTDDLRTAIFSELPENVFSESTQGAPPGGGGRNNRSGRGKIVATVVGAVTTERGNHAVRTML